MKLLHREPGKLVFRVSRREHEALLVALRLRTHLARRQRPMSSDTPKEERLRTAQEDLDAALQEHRRELAQAVEVLLSDQTKCAPQKGGGYHLTLADGDEEMLLQALNDTRVGAWEKLGCPDFEAGDRPEVSEENFLCFWAFQVTDIFQGELLAALSGEE
jgi:hypothetical protein